MPREQFARHPAYGLAQLRGDLERFVFLPGGSDGQPLFAPLAAIGSKAMISYEDLVRVWGAGNVIRIPAKDLDRVELPAEAARFLAEVGLPLRTDWLFELKELEMLTHPRRPGRYCRFGSDLANELCASADTGQVVSVSLDAEHLDRFVNTSVPLFAEFLMLVTAERIRFPGLADDEIDQVVAALEYRLQELDPPALHSPDNWWSVIIEQLQDGLL